MEKLFYKEEDGRWYIDIPEYEGPKDDLEMVIGADIFLNILAEDKDRVLLHLSTTSYEGAECITKEEGDLGLGSGAVYHLESYKGFTFGHVMWLCNVTLEVFGGSFPDKIYFNKIELC